MCNWILTRWQVVPHLVVRLQFSHISSQLRDGGKAAGPQLCRGVLAAGTARAAPPGHPACPARVTGSVNTRLWQRSCRALNSRCLQRCFRSSMPRLCCHQAGSCPQPERSAGLGREDAKSLYAPETAVHRIRTGLKSGQQRS